LLLILFNQLLYNFKIYNSNGTIYKKELEQLLDAEHNENVDLDLTTNSKGKRNSNFSIEA